MPKDPAKPKGVSTSYACFVKTCREEHRKKHPNETVNFQEFSKKCAEKWKTMDEKGRKRFIDMSERDKARYQKEMASYTPAPGEGKGRAKRKKDPNAPKRPMSSFFWFCAEERPKVKAAYPKWGIGEIGKELGRRWEAVTDRTKYEKLAAKDKARWQKENEAYLRKSGGAAKKSKQQQQQQEESEESEEESDEDSD